MRFLTLRRYNYERTCIISQADQKAIELVTNSFTSEHSKRAYSKALAGFLTWRQANDKPFVKATIQEYRQSLTGSASSINLRMSAIRKLAQEAADNGLIDQTIANAVSRVHGVKQQGVRAGNWLTKNQAQSILNAPNIETLKGLRDRAIRDVVKLYGEQIGKPEVAAHDLRLTFVKLAHKGGAGLDQIQLTLGHASIKTIERYLGVSQNLMDAPCDHLGLSIGDD